MSEEERANLLNYVNQSNSMGNLKTGSFLLGAGIAITHYGSFLHNSNLFFSLFSSKPNNELKFQEELFSVKNSC